MTPGRLLTIGYGNRSFDEFLTLLVSHHVRVLVDVRSHPYSRFNPAFRKEPLAAALDAAGLTYRWMGDTLGGRPQDPACYTGPRVDYAKVRRTAAYQQGLAALLDGLAPGEPVAVMCAESRPEACHRTLLIGESAVAAGVAVAHIDERGELCPHDAVMARFGGQQLPLW